MMDDKQHSRNRMKYNVNSDGLNNSAEPAPVYKHIPEEKLVAPIKNGSEGVSTEDRNKVKSIVEEDQAISVSATETAGKEADMVQDETNADGADEQMLGVEDGEKLAEKRDEVKFIKGDHQNGDAKIDIGKINGKAFTGMTKEELMKYANDPFWIRLRWIFFVLFWLIWVGMLIGAILIIIDAPKCAAPQPLPWYKRGPLAKFSSLEARPDDVVEVKKLHASGAIYELPAELTYSVKDSLVEQKIKDIVDQYKDTDVNVILDITPNYVTKDSQLMKEALVDETKRSAFIWIEKPEVPNNWLSIVNGSAWSEVLPNNYVLSQFGDGLYDLHMNDTLIQKEFSDVLRHLIELGVRGIRLKNTKFFIISKSIRNEIPANDPHYIHTQYGFWTHSQTTFQEGLGDVLYEYLLIAKNASSDAFLSVAEDVVRPEVYQTSAGGFGIDMPIYGRFTHVLSAPTGKNLENELNNTLSAVGNTTWLQWNFVDLKDEDRINPSAFALFVSLLPGVPIIPMNSDEYRNISDGIYRRIEQLRLSPSYMHGEFEMHKSGHLVAYSRIKSGNPGSFVAFNPTDTVQIGNYSQAALPEKMTVDIVSENYNVTGIAPKSKVFVNKLTVSPYSTIILTYVPVKSG